jgi:hypothetical protein
VLKSAPEAAPETSPTVAQKAAAKTVSKPVVETVPAAAVKADPVAAKISPDKKADDGGGQ